MVKLRSEDGRRVRKTRGDVQVGRMARTEGEKGDMGTEQNAVRQPVRVQESTTGCGRESGRCFESIAPVAYTIIPEGGFVLDLQKTFRVVHDISLVFIFRMLNLFLSQEIPA